MKYAPAVAGVVFLLAATPVLASPPREDVSIMVSTKGIDLNDPRGVERLRNRVRQAIEKICSPADYAGGSISPDVQCRREMAANAAPTLERLALQTQSDKTVNGQVLPR